MSERDGEIQFPSAFVVMYFLLLSSARCFFMCVFEERADWSERYILREAKVKRPSIRLRIDMQCGFQEEETTSSVSLSLFLSFRMKTDLSSRIPISNSLEFPVLWLGKDRK